MEDRTNYGFFDQFFVAFFQPEKYKNFLGKKKRNLLGFTAIIVVLIVLMNYIMPFMAWNMSVGGVENLITNGIPQFTLKDGVFHIDSPLDIEISQTIHLKADSKVKNFKKSDLNEKYIEEILISENNAILQHGNMKYEIIFAQMKDYELSNQSLVEMIPMVKSSFIFTMVIISVFEYGKYLLMALFFAILCKMGIRSPEGRKVKLSESFPFAVYASSLFSLLVCLNACLNYPLSALLAMLMEVYFTIRWMFRAERSLLGIVKKKRWE